MKNDISTSGNFNDCPTFSENTIIPQSKRAYIKPKLTKHGALQGITLGASVGNINESALGGTLCFDGVNCPF